MHRIFIILSFLFSLLNGYAATRTDCCREFETAAEALHKDGKDPATTAKQARIIGDVAAFIASKDVTSADETGSNAVENNWLEHDAIPSGDELEKHADKSLLEMGLAYNQASIEEGVKETQLWNETATVMAPYAATGIVMGVGMGVPLVAKTAAVIGTAATAHYYGSIAVDSGAKGLKQEAKDHPIRTFISMAPFIPRPKLLKVTQGTPGTLVKAEQAIQQEFRFVQELQPAKKVETVVVQPKKLVATKSASKQVGLDLGKEEGVVGKVKSRGRKTYEDLTPEQRERLPEIVGKRGPYGEMRKLTKGYGHFVEADKDMPWKQMRDTGIPKDELPSTIRYGSDHAAGETFGWKGAQMPVNPNKRQEMAKAIWNTRRELQQQGLYTREVNQELSKYMEDQIKKYPGVFGKGAQK